ncbi:flagellar filament capping protein FliD [Ligilactobacillus agilis]|uniref:Flagellar hook-associated protein 2 n=1 Tax=Ligilactobacillus agilis TaxID=1601 RepID=A0A9Q9JB02_9LACO|nr:flagellar filament capping protein FliD [Ligilactobacillus agilis]UXC64320.1 flagellar filament capping protein FliD [Ligilactobacillus agilis]UXC66322.1 flagellar filament capping protein FliD [Ligilactobacillus agilis]
MATSSISAATSSAFSAATSNLNKSTTDTDKTTSKSSLTKATDASIKNNLGKYTGVTLDVIDQLIEADPLSTRKSSDEDLIKNLNEQTTAWKNISASLSDLKTALNYLKDDDQYYTKATSSSNQNVATISASTESGIGSYSIKVSQLATSMKISGGIPAVLGTTDADSSQKLNLTGSLNLTSSVGTATLNINDSQNINDIATAINKLTVTVKDDKGKDVVKSLGITATVVANHLILRSVATGKDNTISVSSTDGTADSLGLGSQAHSVAGQDAVYNIDGYDLTSASNTITNAINGATITLTGLSAKEADGTLADTTLNVTHDTTYLEAAVENFVNKYNATMKYLNDYAKIDTSTDNLDEKQNGVLEDDSAASRLKSELARLAVSLGVDTDSKTGQKIDTGMTSSKLGISVDRDGIMSIDAEKLTKAIDSGNGIETIKNFFYNTTGRISKEEHGYVTGFLETIKAYNEPDYVKNTKGIINDKLEMYSKQIKDLNSDVTDLETRLATKRESLINQYSAVDAAMEKAEAMLKQIDDWFKTDDNNK